MKRALAIGLETAALLAALLAAPAAHAGALPGATGHAAMPASNRGHIATATGYASATVVDPASIIVGADLDFGRIGGAGVVRLAAGGVRYSGAARPACRADCPAPHPAQLLIGGAADHAYSVSAPGDVTLVGTTADGGRLPVLVLTGVTVEAGGGRITLGGTLILPAMPAAAHYSGSLPVLLRYE